MAQILIHTATKRVVQLINPHRPLTTAETAAGYARHEIDWASGAEEVVYPGGTATITGGKMVSNTNPNARSTVQARREEVREWLRHAEREPIANWGLRVMSGSGGTVHRDRSRNTWWWMETICVAAQTDANLSDATRWGWIQAEMAWTVRRWYDDHVEADWDGFRSVGAFYSTNSDGTPTGARSMTMRSNPQTLAEFLEG